MNEDQLKRSIIRLEAEVADWTSRYDAASRDRTALRAATAAKDEKIDKLESWLTLADNALLALEQGDNEAAHERLSRICAERMDGGWSPFDYPVQVKALKDRVAKLEAQFDPGPLAMTTKDWEDLVEQKGQEIDVLKLTVAAVREDAAQKALRIAELEVERGS